LIKPDIFYVLIHARRLGAPPEGAKNQAGGAAMDVVELDGMGWS
jgi:hypothetical protein